MVEIENLRENVSTMQDDLREMLRTLGLFDGARPQSPHDVFQECIDEVRRLKARVPVETASTTGESEMAKAKTTKTQQPKLEPGTVIAVPCMVVDLGGKIWWIDPAASSIKAA